MQPQPELLPEDQVIFHREQDITLFTTAEEASRLTGDFCLYAENSSDMAVTVSAGRIRINGIPMEHAALVCKARPGEIGKGWLESDPEEWKAAGIGEIRTLSFTLTVLGQDGRIRFTTDEILLSTEGADGT